MVCAAISAYTDIRLHAYGGDPCPGPCRATAATSMDGVPFLKTSQQRLLAFYAPDVTSRSSSSDDVRHFRVVLFLKTPPWNSWVMWFSGGYVVGCGPLVLSSMCTTRKKVTAGGRFWPIPGGFFSDAGGTISAGGSVTARGMST